jgi:hypothetical protein
MTSPADFKGRTPETWCCVDCGYNTAPGCLTREELELRFNSGESGVEQSFDYQSEVYTVRQRVWEAAGMEPMGGCLCIGCLESRLGRRLKPKDFKRGHMFNNLPGTQRLMNRRGKKRRILENA